MSDPIYDTIGAGYAGRRHPDPRIAAVITAALGDARTVVNVGAGTGSYEPVDREVLAVEPSQKMIAQRRGTAAPAVQGWAEALPVADKSFDAAMAVLTIHHWSDWRQGLAEMRRVARDRVVLLTFDTEAAHFWLSDYFPEILALDRRIMPRLEAMAAAFGPADIQTVPVPHDCIDGFLGTYWRRPQVYLDPTARQSMSSFARIDASAGLARLTDDLATGAWQARNADILGLESLDLGYRLLTWRLQP